MGAGDYADGVDLQVVDLADGSQNIGFAGFATGRGEQAKRCEHYLLNLLLTEIDFVIHEGYFILIRMPDCQFRSGTKKTGLRKPTRPTLLIDLPDSVIESSSKRYLLITVDMIHKGVHNRLRKFLGAFGFETAIAIKQFRNFGDICFGLLQDRHVQEGQYLAQVVVGTEATQHSW